MIRENLAVALWGIWRVIIKSYLRNDVFIINRIRSGTCDVRQLLDEGIKVGLGTGE